MNSRAIRTTVEGNYWWRKYSSFMEIGEKAVIYLYSIEVGHSPDVRVSAGICNCFSKVQKTLRIAF